MKKKYIVFASLAACLLLLFVILTIMVKTVDVGVWKYTNTEIGLYKLNVAINSFSSEENKLMKLASDGFLVLAILTIGFYAVLGVIKLVKMKSLFKVDADILVFGCGIISLLLFYILFSLVKINYRPILVDGKLEDSFPSSHTLLVTYVGVMGSYLAYKRLKNKDIGALIYAFGGIAIFVTASGRILSERHWFTDVLGALLLSGALIFVSVLLISLINDKKESKQESK